MEKLKNAYWWARRQVIHRHPWGCIKNRFFRLTKGAGEWDLMDYDSFISKRLAKDLKRYKKRSIGYPGELLGEWDNSEENGYSDEAWEKGAKEWDDILDKMILAFDMVSEEGKYQKDWYDNAPERQGYYDKEKGTYEIPEELSIWYDEFLFPKERAFEATIQEGVDLFAKYFRGLWI